VFTGDARADGNTSSTHLHQSFTANADGMGLVVAPQVAAVVNAGAGVASSGVNASIRTRRSIPWWPRRSSGRSR
jgi:hypothetical protein